MNTRRAGSRSGARWCEPLLPWSQDVRPVLLGRVCGLFARDPSPREETPERAVADREAAARGVYPQLLERDIRRLLDKREDQAGPRLNASRAPVAARAFGQASPCMHSRARQRIALDALTPNRWAACRHERPPAIAASTRVLRSSESAFDMSAGLRPADSLNHRCADLGIDPRSHSSDHALAKSKATPCVEIEGNPLREGDHQAPRQGCRNAEEEGGSLVTINSNDAVSYPEELVQHGTCRARARIHVPFLPRRGGLVEALVSLPEGAERRLGRRTARAALRGGVRDASSNGFAWPCRSGIGGSHARHQRLEPRAIFRAHARGYPRLSLWHRNCGNGRPSSMGNTYYSRSCLIQIGPMCHKGACSVSRIHAGRPAGSQGRTALKIVSRGRCCLTKEKEHEGQDGDDEGCPCGQPPLRAQPLLWWIAAVIRVGRPCAETSRSTRHSLR